MPRIRLCLVLLGLFALTACVRSSGPRQLGGAPEITVVNSSELPGPNGQVGADQHYEFTIGPFDTLIVDVLGIEELNARKFQVDGSGNIVMPIGGEVKVGGLTLGEATDQIAAKLRAAHVREPQVSVNLEESSSQYVTVDGEVSQPGNYPLVSDMTLMRAVAAARGVTEYAKMDDVVIHRTVNGRQMIALYNLAAIRRGAYSDPVLYPHDTVVVGDSPGRRLFTQFLQLTPALVSPIVAIMGGYN
jgi:polysaccharide export outer membrane protein